MISTQSRTSEWIMGIRKESRGSDPILIEKMIMAMTLVEELQLSGLDFIFKGGTSRSKVWKVITLRQTNRTISRRVSPATLIVRNGGTADPTTWSASERGRAEGTRCSCAVKFREQRRQWRAVRD